MFKDLKYIINYYSLKYTINKNTRSSWFSLVLDKEYINLLNFDWNPGSPWYSRDLDNSLLSGIYYLFTNTKFLFNKYEYSCVVETNLDQEFITEVCVQ